MSNSAGPLSEMDLQLREAIDGVLQKSQTADEQARYLEELRSTHPHSIRPASLETFCELPDEHIPEYDCFTFAFDLIECPARIAARQYAPRNLGPIKQPGIADALPGSSFLQFLLLPEQSSFADCGAGDLVVYYDKFGNAQHAGKVVTGAIVSKWGMRGALWQHGLWEVPSSYGLTARFYSGRPKDHVRQRWLAYLERLASRVTGFTSLVSVISENRAKGLNPEELLKRAANRAASAS